MSQMRNNGDDDRYSLTPSIGRPDLELLMYAIPHQQERLSPTEQSSNFVHDVGCTPTLHGIACPVSTDRTFLFCIYFNHCHKFSFPFLFLLFLSLFKLSSYLFFNFCFSIYFCLLPYLVFFIFLSFIR